MSKEKDSKAKTDKTAPTKTLKEKRAAKEEKREKKDMLINSDVTIQWKTPSKKRAKPLS